MFNEEGTFTESEIEEMRESLINQIEGMTPVKFALFSEYVRNHYPDLYNELLQMQAEDHEE